ncbi:aromatic ring-hydroxylating oxygenase subunit alpha [Reyranella sp.]|uniref:aromatic ring-hydroxylating oxygenase subunit alpha n=1 Tax=Reyranella sp. TaxID=1929291 RepID=UPI003BA8A62F
MDSLSRRGARSDASLAKAFLPLTQASHPDGRIYHDPAVLEREKQTIFGRDWLCIGRAEEVAEPGDYKALRLVGQPVLLVRRPDGKVVAYSNTCLHRGVEIASGEGNAKEFTCPYHGWLYGLDGQLLGAAHMRDSEGFDRKTCRLPELPCENFQGWLFVSLNRTPEPFADYIAEFAEKFGYIDMEPMRLGIQRDIPLNCNWKLMVENFIDFYHIGVLHKDTIGRYMKTTDVPYETRKRGQVFINEYDAGSHTQSGEVFVERIPALKDKPARFSQAGVITPNVNFFVRPDYVMLYSSWPVDADTMVMKQFIVFPRHIVESPRFPEIKAQFLVMSDKILGEDFAMVESLQNASKATHFVPGRMSRLEKGVQHFILHNLERIYGAEPPLTAAAE